MLRAFVKKGKKGISPIIATVLLLAFSIALGAIVITFSQKTTSDITQSAETIINKEIQCSLDMSVAIFEINHQPFICYNRTNSNNLEIILENQGGETIPGIQIVTLDSENTPFTSNILSGITRHNRTKVNISLGEGFVFPPIKILVSPLLSSSGSSFEICSNNRVDVEDICQCGTQGCI